MARGLDHIVHAVRDLDAAAALYRSLGFTVGARNRRHANGARRTTSSRLPTRSSNCWRWPSRTTLRRHAPRYFSFGAFNRDFLKRGEGSRCWFSRAPVRRTTEAHFAPRVSATSNSMRFERQGKRPDGTPVKVGVLARLRERQGRADVGIFTCQQHYPENFWNPAFQKHANGVSERRRRRCRGREPERHRAFMQKFAGAAASAK